MHRVHMKDMKSEGSFTFSKKDDDCDESASVRSNVPLMEDQRQGKKMLGGLGCIPVSVPSGQVGMLEHCGKFQTILQPGLACLVPCFESVKLVDLRTQQLECHSDSKTKDNVTVTVKTAVTFCINPERAFAARYTIAQPQAQIRSLIDDVIRSSLPTLTLDESYEAKEHIVHSLKDTVGSGMAKYGFIIENVLITDLRPEASVLHAMNEINSARRMREAAVDKAEADKILAVKAGEADAEAKHLSGVGIARMRGAITDGFKEAINDISASAGLKPSEVMNMMLVTQYLDVLKGFAESGKSSVVVPHGMSFPTDMQAAVRDGMMQAAHMQRD